MIDYKMFPSIFEKIWAGIDDGKSKMDIWKSLPAQERHEINKLIEGDKGEQEKADTWKQLITMYRRELVKYPYVKRAYIGIETCPSCGYDHEDVTVVLEMPYALDHVEELARLDLDFNLAIRPYGFEVEYIDDGALDLPGYTRFYRYSQRRIEISDTLDKASEMLIAGKTIPEVAEALGFTKQAVSDWLDKDWVAYSKQEYKEHRQRLKKAEHRNLIKEANKLFADGYNRSHVCSELKVNHDTMKSWINSDLVTVPPIREEMDAKIVEMALQGEKQIDIAKHFGMGQTTVSERLRKSEAWQRYRYEQVEGKMKLAKQLSEQGISVNDIAESLGRSKSTVRRWLRGDA